MKKAETFFFLLISEPYNLWNTTFFHKVNILIIYTMDRGGRGRWWCWGCPGERSLELLMLSPVSPGCGQSQWSGLTSSSSSWQTGRTPGGGGAAPQQPQLQSLPLWSPLPRHLHHLLLLILLQQVLTLPVGQLDTQSVKNGRYIFKTKDKRL